MIKLFVSDIDGTLLNEHHEISERVKDAVHRLRASGVSFLPASGRSLTMLREITDQLGEQTKCICLNGAQFFDNENKLLISYALEAASVKEIIEIAKQYDIDMDLLLENERIHFGTPMDPREALFVRFTKMLEEENASVVYKFIDSSNWLENFSITDNIDDVLNKEVMKIELFAGDSEVLYPAFEKLQELAGISVVKSHHLNVEITSEKATKGHMVKEVSEYFGYHEDEVLVIGDALNDFTMLSMFKNSYAMGQADDNIKAAATYVAAPNTEDGIANVIDKVIANNK